MAGWAYQMRFLMVLLNLSISGTCSLLYSQFGYMPISAITTHKGLNFLSTCMRVILNTSYRYSLWICFILSSVFFIFQLLIIIPVENIMFQGMGSRNPMPLICIIDVSGRFSWYNGLVQGTWDRLEVV